MVDSFRRLEELGNFIGIAFVKLFHVFALFAIGVAVIWAGSEAFLGMAAKGHFSLEDILLLFIYLELGAMVGIYFRTSKMPVRFLIYVAITALTRTLIGIISIEHKADMGIIIISGGILILTIAVLLFRFGSYYLPLDQRLDDSSELPLAAGRPAQRRNESE